MKPILFWRAADGKLYDDYYKALNYDTQEKAHKRNTEVLTDANDRPSKSNTSRK